jgi:hypothetical protein
VLVAIGAFAGKRVLVTGHTGFKGSWLALWLARAGARVTGYALAPRTERDHFVTAGVAARMAESVIADVRDAKRVREVVERLRPDVVFHLAAQPLVRLVDRDVRPEHSRVPDEKGGRRQSAKSATDDMRPHRPSPWAPRRQRNASRRLCACSISKNSDVGVKPSSTGAS